jgi:hypothetical protein
MHLNKKIFVLTYLFLSSSLISCNNISNVSNNEQDNLIVTYNSYYSYNELKSDLSILNKNNLENETFLFDVQIKGFNTKYFIAGIDYRALNPNFALDENTNSDNLKTREIYYELVGESDDVIFTIVFNNKINYEKSQCMWTDKKLSFNGTVLNYEQNASGDSYYFRYKDDNLLTLKTNHSNYDLVKLNIIQDYLSAKM